VAGLVSLSAALVYNGLTPPAPVPATAPLTEFSAERAMAHTRAIAERPHPTGSADAARVRTYLRAQLTTMGLQVDSQETTAIGTRYQALGHVTNLLARMPGTSPGGPAVLLMSHYDGVPAGPAASDAGSGVSVVLETVRALRSGPPLTHDVIVALTDGEEAGLLGASAFVREHPWAKDVAATLNFEARGTAGRAVMFETGPGNADLVRLLSDVHDISASSLAVTVYRQLNNDTDLSEIAKLDKPALNFAFAGGVERYHTTEDDPAHANPGAIQQEGNAALSVVRALGTGPLPRPVTGDAVFSDLPAIGIVHYDESFARPIALAIIALFLVTLFLLIRRENRWMRDLAIGIVMTVLAVVLSAAAAFGAGMLASRLHETLGGSPGFRGAYALSLALLTIAVTSACWALARRWAANAGLHQGALLVWTALATWITWRVPGASYLFVWPLPLVLLAIMLRNKDGAIPGAALWIATIAAAAVMVPITTLVCMVLVGVVGAGGIAMGVLVSLLVVLLLPQLDAIGGVRRMQPALWAGVASVIAFGVGTATVRASAAHPAPSMLTYVMDADSSDSSAWLVGPSVFSHFGPWYADVFGDKASAPPAWLGEVFGADTKIASRAVPRVSAPGPTVTVLADSQTATGRRLRVRVMTPPRSLDTRVHVVRSAVRVASVDGRVIDTTRFRHPQKEWQFTFAGPPDSGFVLALELPKDAHPALELLSVWSGLPVIPGITVPARPVGTIPVQNGDVRLVRRRVTF
jgi:hypothetical protein